MLPDDCKGKSKCSIKPLFQIICECGCYDAIVLNLYRKYLDKNNVQ
jgi:hypothetical protein